MDYITQTGDWGAVSIGEEPPTFRKRLLHSPIHPKRLSSTAKMRLHCVNPADGGSQLLLNTVCPTRYQTRHFFNNSNTNEDIATKFEQEYVRCVRNEEECVCSRCNILISGKLIKEMPGSVASGTPCTIPRNE